ncbi:MAG: HAMP domain-containing histidine kinase, partial [Solirubrobacterales bacterium]|nr:HAMP domain-containing histidine kinase [Solirubrobacterales bacterium]
LATLAVAALALLSPLQDRLRSQQASALRSAALNARPRVEDAIRADLRSVGATGERTSIVLRQIQTATGGQAAVLGLDRTVLEGSVPVGDDLQDITEVLARNRSVISRQDDRQRVALSLNTKPLGFEDIRDPEFPFFVLALRQSDAQIADTVAQVRQAFVTAAIVGLAVALILGVLLTTTLTRRLARLRDAAMRITTHGMEVSTPVDTRNDEVGDLSRAMVRMQAGLRRQEEARRQFVATASHELRTPLTSLSGNLELLGEDLAAQDFDREDARQQVISAQGELARLRNLATELLDLSRLDAGVELRSEPVELGEVVRAVAAEFALQAHARQTLLEVVPPRGPCWARGDPDAVARVARILIDNALRYTPPNTSVRVTSGYAGEGATVMVIDDGPGVPEEEAEAIFERFRRGTTTRGEGGFGLGLAIGRELAERLGGGLELSPTPRGARFVLTLPIELPSGGRAPQQT